MKNSLLFIVCDALRFDRLGCYGYRKETSLNIDRLAREGVLFQNAFCHINTTAPSFTAILTGCYPWTTGIIRHFDPREQEQLVEDLDPRFKMLAEILYRSGYNTYSSEWLGNWFKRGNIWTMPSTYFDEPYLQADKLVDWALTRMNEKPYFLFLHFFDNHWPYLAPRKYADEFYEGGDLAKDSLEPVRRSYSPQAFENFLKYSQGIRDLAYYDAWYDGETKFMDEQIARLIEKAGEDVLIVLTADHGENLSEDGLYYVHYGLKENIIHVPLIFNCPKLMGKGSRKGLVEHIDVVPTILNLFGIEKRETFDGVDLLKPDFDGKDAIYAMERRTRSARCVRTERFKLLEIDSWLEVKWSQRMPARRYEIYDLEVDPMEIKNVAMKNRKVLDELVVYARRMFQT